MKMLHPRGLSTWTDASASAYRKATEYSAIFVAADRSWQEQQEAISSGPIPALAAEWLQKSSFCTTILLAAVDTMQVVTSEDVLHAELAHLGARLSRQDEARLASSIAQAWELSPKILSLEGIREALHGRLKDLAILRSQWSGTDSGKLIEEARSTRYLHLDFLQALQASTDSFDQITRRRTRKWALIFDELEIAPTRVMKYLLEALRSVDQRFVFKLSLTPYTPGYQEVFSIQAAFAGHDYKTLQLWYPYKEEAYSFSEALLQHMLRARGLPEVPAAQVFGHEQFDEYAGEEDEVADFKPYAEGSPQYKYFEHLSATDRTFASYLSANGIKLSRMHKLRGDKRAQFIRKVSSIVLIRDTFRRDESRIEQRQQEVRSRKNPQLYTGARTLFAIAEGNPRWFLGTIGPLLNEYAATGRVVPREKQARAIGIAANRLRALLSTIPLAGSRRDYHTPGVLGILDMAGNYFFDQVVRGPFKPEPRTTFVLDSKTPSDIQNAIGIAVNAGALVTISSPGVGPVGNIRGRRFRFSYMLATKYRLPLFVGKEKQLSLLLQEVVRQRSAVDGLLFDRTRT